jgi:CDP-diacylglycerol--serine O-phosphatidyltransferase
MVTIQKHIPNFITSLNLAAGFMAVIFAANDDLVAASYLILAAMIFDFMDGFSARLLKAYSDIGKELDSLADVVSFGVAPAMIIYKLISVRGSLFTAGSDATFSQTGSLLLNIIPVLMPVCAALRLAKFNIDTEQKTSFKGLPTPANALAVITVLIAANYSDIPAFKSFISSPALLAVYTIILSLLMVSRIPLLSLKMTTLRLKGNEGRYLLAVLVLSALILSGIASAPLIIPLYIIVSLIARFF